MMNLEPTAVFDPWISVLISAAVLITCVGFSAFPFPHRADRRQEALLCFGVTVVLSAISFGVQGIIYLTETSAHVILEREVQRVYGITLEARDGGKDGSADTLIQGGAILLDGQYIVLDRENSRLITLDFTEGEPLPVKP